MSPCRNPHRSFLRKPSHGGSRPETRIAGSKCSDVDLIRMTTAWRARRGVICQGAAGDACLPFILDCTSTMIVARDVEVHHVELQSRGSLRNTR